VRARAERAGVPTAADTPIAVFPDAPARPEIQSLLDRAAGSVPPTPEAPHRISPPPAETPTSTLLARALDRLEARRVRRTPDAVPAPEPMAPSPLPIPASPLHGLRRLAGLGAGMGSPEAAAPTPRDLPPGAALPALPAVARERQEEEELGRRIGRLLRREAERQGLDVSGVQG